MDTVENSVGLPIPNDLPPIYHLPPNRFFFENVHDGYWQEATQDTIKAELAATFGQNPIPARRGELSQVDRTLLRIKKEARIDGVAALGWEEMGIRMINGKRVLVEKGCNRVEPMPGLWKEIEEYLTRLFGPDQLPYFLGWLSTSAKGFYDPTLRRYGQAMVLAGPRASGKSYLQMQIITKVLGGTVGRPYEWLIGRTQFNSDLFEAVHLISEDDFHLADPNSRKVFGASVKKVTANTTQEYNKKHGSKLVLVPYWRLSISLNGETHNLAGLPELDEALGDKMTILMCHPGAIHLPTSGSNGNQMEAATNSELPAFIHYLLYEHQIPEEIADGRYGVKAYINPHIKSELEQLGEECLLLDELQVQYAGSKGLVKTTHAILRDLKNVDTVDAVTAILKRQYAFNGCMRKLAAVQGSGVVSVQFGYSKAKAWSLTFPEKN